MLKHIELCAEQGCCFEAYFQLLCLSIVYVCNNWVLPVVLWYMHLAFYKWNMLAPFAASVEACRRNIKFNGSVACAKVESHLADARVYMLTHPKEFDVVCYIPFSMQLHFFYVLTNAYVNGNFHYLTVSLDKHFLYFNFLLKYEWLTFCAVWATNKEIFTKIKGDWGYGFQFTQLFCCSDIRNRVFWGHFVVVLLQCASIRFLLLVCFRLILILMVLLLHS